MIFKSSVNWKKVTEQLPEPDQECLVWTGHYMYVSTADFYSEEVIASWPEDQREAIRKTKGRFSEFGQKNYFDDEKVFWAPIPLAPGEENPPPPDPFEGMISKDVYLKQGEYTIGIHAIGYPGPYTYTEQALDGTRTEKTDDFQQMEIWGNEYNEQFQMIGRGSFRVHERFDVAVREFEKEGWVRIEGPKKDNA